MGGLCGGTQQQRGQVSVPQQKIKKKDKTNKILGIYEIRKYLCRSNLYKMKLGTKTNNDQKVIIKMFDQHVPRAKEEQIIKDVELNYITIQNQCDHLIKVLKTDKAISYMDSVQENKAIKVSYIVTEYCENGLLFDWIRKIDPLEEHVARYFFKQLIDCLQFCEGHNVAHFNLQPEFLLLDKNFNLKVADFCMNGNSNAKERAYYDAKYSGNPIYMAPEVFERSAYDGVKADIFSCAILLYRMIFGEHPFDKEKASMFNNRYERAVTDPETYWGGEPEEGELDQFGIGAINVNDGYTELKDLLGLMWQKDPNLRPSYQSILKHEWFKGQMPTQEDIINEFSGEYKKLLIEDRELTLKTEQNEAVRLSRGIMNQQRHDRLLQAAPDGVAYKAELKDDQKLPYIQLITGHLQRGNKYQKQLLPLEKSISPQGQSLNHITSFHPDDIEECVAQYLKNDEDIENVQVHPTKYKIKFNFKTHEFDCETKKAVTISTLIKMKIFSNDMESYCVEFSQLQGNYDDFITGFQDIYENVLTPFDVWTPYQEVLEDEYKKGNLQHM